MYIDKKENDPPPKETDLIDLAEYLPAARQVIASLSPDQIRWLREKYTATPKARARWLRRLSILFSGQPEVDRHLDTLIDLLETKESK